MEHFSNGAILKWSNSQIEHFSNGANWGRHHQLDDSLVGQLTTLHSVSAQEPAIIRQLLPLANCATTQIQIHLPKHANTRKQTHRHRRDQQGIYNISRQTFSISSIKANYED